MARRLLASCLFGLIYATGAAFAYERGVRVFLFHFAFAALSAWAFFTVSGLLDRRSEAPSLSHRLIKWPAFVALVCAAAAAMFYSLGWRDWFRPVALPLLAALALLCGSFGGYLSLILRR